MTLKKKEYNRTLVTFCRHVDFLKNLIEYNQRACQQISNKPSFQGRYLGNYWVEMQ